MKQSIYAHGDEGMPLVTVNASDRLPFVVVNLDEEPAPEDQDGGIYGQLYFTREEAAAFANALLWASAEARD